jgi:aminopeptidase N
MKNLLICACLLCSQWLSAQMMIQSSEWCASNKKQQSSALLLPDLRSDSVDILHTAIRLNIVNVPMIQARCAVDILVKTGPLSGFRLDLENYQVDSVYFNGVKTAFTYQSPNLQIAFPAALTQGTTAAITVFYHGAGVQDPTGWGGIYNQGSYFYNLGVGFDADPHSFGRAWFPCFDNFVERSSFEVEILSLPSRKTYSNGYMVSENLENGLLRRVWRLETPIPSYLACFSSGPYVSFKRTYPGMNGPIPVEIAVTANDTNKVKGTFVHLPDAIAAYEHWFGPYRWNKIGYSVVPFQSGAMEHATNIAIMQNAVNGNTSNETLWAHELSHHWWGDLATCSTAEDMWLNEGWAVFSEHLFTEWIYGKAAYDLAVQTNFINVLQTAHIQEGMYRAVSGLPHEYTYGNHVYNKGAVVAHNLRTYMGDSLFRIGCRAALDQTQFKDWSSADLRDQLQLATGLNLDGFFNDWVFSPGFSHFSVDSFTISDAPNPGFIQVSVQVQQKLRGAPHFHQNVPLDFVFVNASRARYRVSGVVSGQNTTLSFQIPASFGTPLLCWANPNLKLLVARTEKEHLITAPGQYSFATAKMEVKVNTASDTTLMRVEYHFAMPDTAATVNPHGFKFSNRYWTVDGLFSTDFQATTNLFYDGRGTQDQLDTELFAQTGPSEDSLLLVYRSKPGQSWEVCAFSSKLLLGSTVDKYGFFKLNQLLPGQYAIVKGSALTSTYVPKADVISLQIAPNPARQKINLKTSAPCDLVLLLNQEGVQVQSWQLNTVNENTLQLNQVPPGTYWLLVYSKSGMGVQSLILIP